VDRREECGSAYDIGISKGAVDSIQSSVRELNTEGKMRIQNRSRTIGRTMLFLLPHYFMLPSSFFIGFSLLAPDYGLRDLLALVRHWSRESLQVVRFPLQ
jgi:hypothetical protein